MEKIFTYIGIFVALLGLTFLISLLFAFPTMWIVNYLFSPSALVAVFGTPAIGVWKAFWINFLCGTLVKSTSTSKK